MKNLMLLAFFGFLGICITTSCKNGNKNATIDNNPVFQSDPVLKAISEEIQKTPANAKLYFDRGVALRKMQLDTLAIKDFKKAASIDTAKAEYYSVVGDVLFENKDINGSVEWFQKALAINPSDKKSRLKIAKMFLYIRKYPEAFSQVDIVLRSDAFNPEAYFLKGMLYKDMKDTAKALSSFLTAVQVSPDYKDAIVQLGMIYSSRKDSIALKYLENAYKVDSTDVFPIFARGVFYQDIKQYALAKEEYRRCIFKDRHYVDAYFNLAYIYMQQDSVAKAKRQYDIVTKIEPTNSTAYYDRGVCLEAMDSIKQAIEDYRHARILDPKYKSPADALKRLKVKDAGLESGKER